jgi:hypothetical protein
LTIAIWCLLFSAALAADDLPPVIQQGFDAYSEAGAEAAWKTWRLEGTQRGIGEKEEWTAKDKPTFVSMISDVEKNYGRSLGFEVIRTFDVGASYKTIFILWRFERKPLFCMFVCYRGNSDWRVLNFFINSDPRSMLPEAVSGLPVRQK